MRDREVVDYGLVSLPATDLAVRGPLPKHLEAGDYFVCLGAAQTFGRFTPRPYPALVSEQLGMDGLNLAWGGVGPRFFVERPQLVEYANNARFAVVQVMSGRSEDNEIYESHGGSSGTRPGDEARVLARDVYAELLASGDEERIRRIVAQTRVNWLASLHELLGRLEVPTILLWFSKRTPDYVEELTDVGSLFGEFPQLVNAEMVELARREVDAYVECVTTRGSPQLLVSRFTGRPTEVAVPGRTWTHNTYYPSPEMHVDAARALLPACEPLLRP